MRLSRDLFATRIQIGIIRIREAQIDKDPTYQDP